MKITGINPTDGLNEVETVVATLSILEEILYDYKLPKLGIEIDIDGLHQYAVDRNCSILDLLPEEKNRFIKITRE